MQNSSGASTITATVQPQIIKESQIQPVWHVIVLNVLTVGFYGLVWFYKNARILSKRLKSGTVALDLGEETAPEPEAPPGLVPVKLAKLTSQEAQTLELVKRTPPMFLTLGMALPVINFFLGIYFFKMLAELYPDKSSVVCKKPFVMGVFLALMTVGALCLSRLHLLYFLLYCVAISVPQSIAQHWLNAYWRSIELDDDVLVRHSFSTVELVMLILGIMLLGLIIAGFFIVPGGGS